MAVQCGHCGHEVQDFFASYCPSCREELRPETLIRNERPPTGLVASEAESFGLPGENTPEAIEAARAPRWQHAVQAVLMALFFVAGGIYMYHRFSTWETEGGTLHMPSLAFAVYKIAGKEGIAAMFLFASAMCVYFAFGVCYDWPGCKRSDMEN